MRGLLQVSGPPTAVAASDVQMVAERITSDVAATPGEFVTPPGYAHLSLALVDAIYSIRSRYPAVKRVVAAYCAARAKRMRWDQGLDTIWLSNGAGR